MNKEFTYHVKEMLSLGKKTILENPRLTKETGTVNAKGDRSIEMDVRIEQVFIDYLKKNNLPVNIFSEEIGILNFHPTPNFLIAFDPLDGSTNYKIGKGLLPFGSLIAVYDGVNPKLSDVIAAGAIEYTRDLFWIFDGEKTIDMKGNQVQLKDDWAVHHSTPVYLDLYYREGYEKYQTLAQKVFVRNTGSTIGNVSYTLSNVAAGLGGVCMRAEEIGAVYALVKGAHGVAVNHQGEDIGKELFNAEQTYPIIAGAPTIVEFAVEQLKI
jgi:fructose-1,6-bisphosphatase/inositol monophosphatase family enzyme